MTDAEIDKALMKEVMKEPASKGVEFVTDVDEGQRILDEYNGKDPLSKSKKRAIETASLNPKEGSPADISTADGAKVRNNLDTANESERKIAIQKQAVESKGIVSPNLNNAEVEIVKVKDHHPFNPNQHSKGLKKQVREYAKENGLIKVMSDEETGGKGNINISLSSIDKIVDDIHKNKNVDKDAALNAIVRLHDIIRTSVEAEVHPDYGKGKNGKRSSENPVNPDVLIHRLYGAIEIDGKVYRTKTTVRENIRNTAPDHLHTLEVTKIELLAGQNDNATGDAAMSRNSKSSISGAKLLNNIEKTYDSGKKLLEESEKSSTEPSNPIKLQKVSETKPMFFKTPDGHAYGYTYKGKIYLDPRIATAETPIHEYGHLWAEMKRQSAPEEWSRIKDVLLNDKLVEPFIEKVRREYPELEGKEDDFVEEVLTQFSGKHGAEKLRRMAQEIKEELGGDATAETIAEVAVRRVRSVLNEFWKGVCDMMGWTDGNGKEYTVVTELKDGRENFITFYSDWNIKDKEASTPLASNTPEGAHSFGDSASSGAKVQQNPDTSKDSGKKMFKTPDGHAYGYTYKGKIYLDPRIATAETPIHEYGHLWAEMKRQSAPDEWSRIKDVLLNDKLVEPFIEKVRREYPELEGKEDDFVEEVLTQFSGKHGAEKLRRMAQEIKEELGGDATAETIAEVAVRRVRSVLNEFWKGVCDMMGWQYTSAEDIADRILSDMLNGVNPNEEIVKARKNRASRADQLKQTQLDIILKNNPADDVNMPGHTWIRSLEDIKTFREALEYDGLSADDVTPDFTADMVKEALDKGEVTVYSSKPIKDGAFVTPSKMEAKNYAGEGKVYSKKVPLSDVAWIDSIQGQYAEVSIMGDGTSTNINDINPVGKNRFGGIYDQFRGKVKEAFDFLTKKKEGYLKGVFYRDDLGDIDLAWGSAPTPYTGKGLAHIIRKHIETLSDFQDIDEAMRIIEDVVNDGIAKPNSDPQLVDIEKGNYRVVVAKNAEGNWILSALDYVRGKKQKLNEKEKGKTPPPSKTPGQSNVEAGAVTSNPPLSGGKDTKNTDTLQEKTEKSASGTQESENNPLKFQRVGSPEPEMTPEERQYWNKWDQAMKKWKERNAIPEDAEEPGEKPQKSADEDMMDYVLRLTQYNKDKALWKTAPKLEDYRQVRSDKDTMDAVQGRDDILFQKKPESKPYALSEEKKDAEGNRMYEREGSIDLWRATPLLAKAGRQQAPVRLSERNMNHIIDRHSDRLDTEDKVFEFLDNVFANAKILRRAKGRGMFVVVENENTDSIAMIKLMPSEDGDYYNIDTAGYYRKNKWKESEEVIADLSEPGQSDAAADAPKPQVPDENGGELINAEAQLQSSGGKDTKNTDTLQEKTEKSASGTQESENNPLKFQRVGSPEPEMTPEERQYWNKWDQAMRKWKERNAIPEDAEEPGEKPQKSADEDMMDYVLRLTQYNKDKALWKTAPKLEDYRGDPSLRSSTFRSSWFQSTPLREGRPSPTDRELHQVKFQSTPLREGRRGGGD